MTVDPLTILSVGFVLLLVVGLATGIYLANRRPQEPREEKMSPTGQRTLDVLDDAFRRDADD